MAQTPVWVRRSNMSCGRSMCPITCFRSTHCGPREARRTPLSSSRPTTFWDLADERWSGSLDQGPCKIGWRRHGLMSLKAVDQHAVISDQMMAPKSTTLEQALCSHTYEALSCGANHLLQLWLTRCTVERHSQSRAKASCVSAAFVSSAHTFVNQMLMVVLPVGTGRVDTGCRSTVGGKLYKKWVELAIQESAAGDILSIRSWETNSFRNGVDLSSRNWDLRRNCRGRNSAGLSRSDWPLATLPRGARRCILQGEISQF